MKTHLPKFVLMATLTLSGTLAMAADEPRTYTEGPVSHVSFIKIKPGMFDNYMKYLSTTYKPLMEEYKKQGIILDYKVYQSNETHNNSEADLVLTVTYKNMAALDGLAEKTDPAAAKVFGSRQKQSEGAISRESMRESLGDEFIRELVLK